MNYIDPTPVPVRPPARFLLEAVVVCDQYHDFLRHTLPANKHIFDKIVVVTAFEDRATQRICEFNHVEVVRTDVGESRKGHFRKGSMINAGLDALAMGDWVIHLDADIALPPQTRLLFERAGLEKRNLYGVDRFNVRGYAAWEEFQRVPRLQHECDTYVHVDGFPLGTRIMNPAADGYVPLGFFQAWNPAASGVRRYPEGHTSAAREDVQFAQLWPRRRRALIPEIVAYHLESDGATMAMNWGGRKSAAFERAPAKE